MRRDNFTLIELSIVLLLALIIIALAAGTYAKMGAGIRLDSTVQQVGGELLRARQLAQAERTKIAVLMPGTNADISNERKYACFRIAYVYFDDSSSTYKAGKSASDSTKYPDDSKWVYTKPGITIMEADGDVGIQYYDSSASSYYYGKEPQDDNYTSVSGCDLSELGGGSSVNGIRAVIFSPSNQIKGDSRYVTIGEANYGAGRWNVPREANIATNVSAANQLTIELNRFTGGIRYLRPHQYQ